MPFIRAAENQRRSQKRILIAQSVDGFADDRQDAGTIGDGAGHRIRGLTREDEHGIDGARLKSSERPQEILALDPDARLIDAERVQHQHGSLQAPLSRERRATLRPGRSRTDWIDDPDGTMNKGESCTSATPRRRSCGCG